MSRIIVGGLQFSPDDPFPAPVIAVNYADEAEAKSAVRLLTSLQNGTCPLKMGEAKPVFMGDTNIKVSFLGSPASGGDIICEIMAKHDPRHYTCGFYVAEKVTLEQVKAFRQLLELHRSYTFTVACNEQVMTRDLDVVKYLVTERGVPS
ncbi:MAG: hypothetical protein WD024_04550 [Bacillota bacterium]